MRKHILSFYQFQDRNWASRVLGVKGTKIKIKEACQFLKMQPCSCTTYVSEIHQLYVIKEKVRENLSTPVKNCLNQ